MNSEGFFEILPVEDDRDGIDFALHAPRRGSSQTTDSRHQTIPSLPRSGS
jgi:hypothetical protein